MSLDPMDATTPRLNRGDEVVVRGIVQMQEPDGNVLLYLQNQSFAWFTPWTLHVIRYAPKRQLKPGDRLVDLVTNSEYLYVGGKWVCTFVDNQGERSDDASTWDEKAIREHPERFQYFPRSEVPAPDPADQATHPADNRTEQP